MTKRIWDDFLTEKDQRIYQLAGYGKRGGFGTRPALFIIDVQYNFCGDEPGGRRKRGLRSAGPIAARQAGRSSRISSG